MSTRIYYKLGQHWYPPSPSVMSSIGKVEVQCMRCGSVNSPETLGMTETLIASVRFHQWPTFLLMSGPHFPTHHQLNIEAGILKMERESDLDEKWGLRVACLLLVVRGRNHVLLRSTVFALRLNACSHMSVMVQDVRAAANTKTHPPEDETTLSFVLLCLLFT